jgi:hypothetical protein
MLSLVFKEKRYELKEKADSYISSVTYIPDGDDRYSGFYLKADA